MNHRTASSTMRAAASASASSPPISTRRRSARDGSKGDGFSRVSSGVWSRVTPAALTMRGSPGSAATASSAARGSAVSFDRGWNDALVAPGPVRPAGAAVLPSALGGAAAVAAPAGAASPAPERHAVAPAVPGPSVDTAATTDATTARRIPPIIRVTNGIVSLPPAGTCTRDRSSATPTASSVSRQPEHATGNPSSATPTASSVFRQPEHAPGNRSPATPRHRQSPANQNRHPATARPQHQRHRQSPASQNMHPGPESGPVGISDTTARVSRSITATRSSPRRAA